MKKIVDIRNESGFGLIHVLAVTLIVSIALLGLFMSIEFARGQADANYHTRSALLLAQGYLEEIKYNNRNNGVYTRPTVGTLTTTKTIDSNKGRSVIATITVTSSTTSNAFSVGLNRYRDGAYVTVSWKEKPTVDMTNSQNRTRSIMMQEDYYWKRSGVDVN